MGQPWEGSSRGWCGRVAAEGWGYGGAHQAVECFGMWLLTHVFSVLQKRERDSVKTSVAAPPQQLWRRELKAPAVSLQRVGFCSTLPCLPLGCLVMSVAYLATNVSVCMQSFICLCAFMKRRHSNQRWHRRLVLALEKSCVPLFVCVFHYANKVVLVRLS